MQQPRKLIYPAHDYTSAFDLEDATVSDAVIWFAGMLNRRHDLGLRVNVADGKLYVADQDEKPATKPTAEGVTYPSGVYLERHPKNNAPEYSTIDASMAPPLVKAKPGTLVSKHFGLDEFRPGSSAYDGIRLSPRLVEALEKIRARVGSALVITSGYRPPQYNKAVGGDAESTHIDGLAADFYAPALNTAALCRICDDVIGAGGGVGYYPASGFVHVDVRGSHARWDGY